MHSLRLCWLSCNSKGAKESYDTSVIIHDAPLHGSLYTFGADIALLCGTVLHACHSADIAECLCTVLIWTVLECCR